jgi:GNAT superfamily N-acetyltransferase
MTITFQEESFTAAWPELEAHLCLHWDEVGQDRDRMPLAVDVGTYTFMEQQGQLSLVTVRSQGLLGGYLLSLLHTHLHAKTVLCAYVDVYYVVPHLRGQGLGIRLLEEAETLLRARGVQKVIAGSTVEHDASAVFARCGWRPAEMFYSKWIGE